MEYPFNKTYDIWYEEVKPFIYTPCYDGISIQSGSLSPSGFQPYGLNGLTLPEEIDGILVTELKGRFSQGEVGYIEASSLKRINIDIVVDKDNNGNYTCDFPVLCGSLNRSLSYININYIADEGVVVPIRDETYRSCIANLTYNGSTFKPVDNESGQFEPSLFHNCQNLTTITGCFEGYCLSGHTFEGCSSLIASPNLKVTYLNEMEFINCTSLRGVHLNEGLKGIGDDCFRNCRSLFFVNIPESLEYIGRSAFEGCVLMDRIYLPPSVTEIGKNAFAYCDKLTIHGAPGSVAEQYALEHEIRFVSNPFYNTSKEH